jgi:hypothetical protein
MLTQSEVDTLLNMLKRLVNEGTVNFPTPDGWKTLDVVSENGKEKFLIDINRKGKINLSKCTYQNRYRNYIILLRLDVGGPDHTNPDGEIIPTPHLHIYKENFNDTWAIPLPKELFTDTGNLIKTFIEFLEYCKIINIDRISIQEGLLS